MAEKKEKSYWNITVKAFKDFLNFGKTDTNEGAAGSDRGNEPAGSEGMKNIFKDENIPQPKNPESAKAEKATAPDAINSLTEAADRFSGLIDAKRQTIKRSNGRDFILGIGTCQYDDCTIYRKNTEMARLRVVELSGGRYLCYVKDAFGKESKPMEDIKEVRNYLKAKGVEVKEAEKAPGAKNNLAPRM